MRFDVIEPVWIDTGVVARYLKDFAVRIQLRTEPSLLPGVIPVKTVVAGLPRQFQHPFKDVDDGVIFGKVSAAIGVAVELGMIEAVRILLLFIRHVTQLIERGREDWRTAQLLILTDSLRKRADKHRIQAIREEHMGIAFTLILSQVVQLVVEAHGLIAGETLANTIEMQIRSH